MNIAIMNPSLLRNTIDGIGVVPTCKVYLDVIAMPGNDFDVDGLDGCAILLVEDDAVISGDVTSIIEMAGGRVIGPADSLGQGFHLLDGGRIDCALLDINLNSLLVFGLADALAERGVPIVFLSADSPASIPTLHRHQQFVQKPFAKQDLLAAIHAAMDENRKASESKRAHGFEQKPTGESPMIAR